MKAVAVWAVSAAVLGGAGMLMAFFVGSKIGILFFCLAWWSALLLMACLFALTGAVNEADRQHPDYEWRRLR